MRLYEGAEKAAGAPSARRKADQRAPRKPQKKKMSRVVSVEKIFPERTPLFSVVAENQRYGEKGKTVKESV